MPLKTTFGPREGDEEEEAAHLEPHELRDEDFSYEEDEDDKEDVEEKPRR